MDNTEMWNERVVHMLPKEGLIFQRVQGYSVGTECSINNLFELAVQGFLTV